jgi:Coenzyme PQQ synthesis protein D (PqqD)
MTTTGGRQTSTYCVSVSLTHERLDDEVIAIDLESGAYFALDDAAADGWSILAAGGSLDDAIDAVATRFAVTPDEARPDLERFAEELVEAGLLERVDADPVPVELGPRANASRPYRAPAIERFNDLEDLLLLDPIHEVDDAGWPVSRADELPRRGG